MKFKDYYQTLDLKKDASQDEIKRAYRKLARKLHPDVNKSHDAEEKFKEIGEAYEVLQDPEKRAAYDKFGSDWQAGQDFKPPPNWDAGFEFSGGGFTQADASQFSDFFESLFGRQTGSSHARPDSRSHGAFHARGQDVHAKIVINFEDSYQGTQKSITLSRPVVDQNGHVSTSPHAITLSIPKGVIEGQQIRLEGQGGQGSGQAGAGDLFLEIAFAPHRIFTMEKRDVHLSLPVTPWEAALGATVSVPTLGGTVELKIPHGSQSGKKLRLKGRGLSSTTLRGHQYVTLTIITPEPVTEAQKKIYEEMARLMPTNPRKGLGV
ncbi:MAG: DnaJ domain-containing protein [Proteobacteria bacterium]|jgi:curved DNA-binding protein|nr:J domain-containing protein [Desulfocapsa sp.]MBU3943162.1 DnaJ domain-containing protein [Pseudomonadota bacterium]MCG2745067.1 DnaJ domain-containing protein [Desulfobacteraceae bacterium]MBU3984312.1 DnaJ domain-containing protein [Pseudomonadota bacterium]MBU4030341.1 DnaJ domain-containing protein [Pseudomonadota bacterium]